jgi:Carboxypeptidase regulatory-like domain
MQIRAGRRSRLTVVLTVVVGLAGSAAVVEAQAIRTTLRGAHLGQPVAGALVLLTDSLGRELGRVLTDESGRVRFDPGPGSYRLRVLRIGLTRWETPMFRLAVGDTLRTALSAPETPVVLSGLTVEAERRCRVRPAEGSAAATLWEEARKALEATALTVQERLYRFQTVSYTRHYEHIGDVPTDDDRVVGTGNSSWPFASLPPESLAARGYLQADAQGVVRYYGPDLEVLFSDPFLSTHCFRVRAPEDTGGGALVGLGFEPVMDRRLTDIAGVLWLDPRSAELRDLEFYYTNLGRWAGSQAGGSITFARLPSGAWVIRKWYIRAPVPLVRRRVTGAEGGVRPLATVDTVGIAGFQEEGAWVTTVLTARGSRIATYGEHP